MTAPAWTRAAICAAARSRQADCKRHLARAAFALQFLATARGPSRSVPFHTHTLADARLPPSPATTPRLPLVTPPAPPTLPPLSLLLLLPLLLLLLLPLLLLLLLLLLTEVVVHLCVAG